MTAKLILKTTAKKLAKMISAMKKVAKMISAATKVAKVQPKTALKILNLNLLNFVQNSTHLWAKKCKNQNTQIWLTNSAETTLNQHSATKNKAQATCLILAAAAKIR